MTAVTLLDRTVGSVPPTRPVPVAVNGVVISPKAIARETQHHPAASAAEAWTSAARALVVRELLLQEARRLQVPCEPETDAGGRREPDEEALIRALIAGEIRVPVADEDTCRRVYDRDPAAFRTPDLFEVRHILIAASPDEAEERTAARAQAVALVETLRVEPGRFAMLAGRHSACPSASVGGVLGQIGPGQTVLEFEAALAGTSGEGLLPEPVESRYGFHVVDLVRRIDGRMLPFELACPLIAGRLEAESHRRAIRLYIARLVSEAEIDGRERLGLEGPNTPSTSLNEG